MDSDTMRRRLAEARVGHLATAGRTGAPHLVPLCFVLEGELVFWAVDAKPKSGAVLRRLRNLDQNPRAALLVDHYGEDWTRLWWVRVDCSATVLEPGTEAEGALDLLAAKYQQYGASRPPGPVVKMRIERWAGWEWSEAR